MPRRKSDWVDATRPIPPTVAPLVRSVLAAVYPETSCIRIVSGLWLPLLLLRSCTHIRLCDKPLRLKHPVPHVVVAIAIKRAVYTVTVFCRVVLVSRFVNTANQRWQASDAVYPSLARRPTGDDAEDFARTSRSAAVCGVRGRFVVPAGPLAAPKQVHCHASQHWQPAQCRGSLHGT